MATTIQISKNLAEQLKRRKLYDKESYEEIIRNLLEDTEELSAQAKKEIDIAQKHIAQGKTVSWEEVKRKACLL